MPVVGITAGGGSAVRLTAVGSTQLRATAGAA